MQILQATVICCKLITVIGANQYAKQVYFDFFPDPREYSDSSIFLKRIDAFKLYFWHCLRHQNRITAISSSYNRNCTNSDSFEFKGFIFITFLFCTCTSCLALSCWIRHNVNFLINSILSFFISNAWVKLVITCKNIISIVMILVRSNRMYFLHQLFSLKAFTFSSSLLLNLPLTLIK